MSLIHIVECMQMQVWLEATYSHIHIIIGSHDKPLEDMLGI